MSPLESNAVFLFLPTRKKPSYSVRMTTLGVRLNSTPKPNFGATRYLVDESLLFFEYTKVSPSS